MERLMFDYHLAKNYTREAHDHVRAAQDKVHAAVALFHMDPDSPGRSKDDAAELEQVYDALSALRSRLFERGRM